MAAAQLTRTWDILENAGSGSTPVTEPAAPPPEVIAAVRAAFDQVYARYLRRRGKRRWCDKSLDSYQYAELIAELYPQARFVCLYRHCMDVVASGVEVCPWGLHRHGFDPFAAQHPGNSVAAIGSYWLSCVQAIMAFEEAHPGLCHRIRYEDLVTAPEETAAAMFSFLGAAPVPGITQACFQAPHEANGPGDEKVWFTREVTADSVGRGVRVPAGALTPALRQGINATLAKLGYRQVDDEWNTTVGPVELRDGHGPRSPEAAEGRPHDRGELEAAVRAIDERIQSRPAGERAEISAHWPALAGHTVALLVEAADGGHAELRWSFGGSGPADRHDDGDGPSAVIIASPSTWRSLLDGEANMVAELWAGRIRCVNRRDTHRLRSDEIHAVASLLGLAQLPVTGAANGADGSTASQPGHGEPVLTTGLAVR